MLFCAEKLGRCFRQGDATVPALEEVSFTIDNAEYVALAGPSGGGKTTLLNVLGLLDQEFEGELRFRGHEVRGLGPAARAGLRLSSIGFVFQNFHLLPMLDVRDNVALPGWRLSGDRRKARARAEELLSHLGLDHRLTQHPSRLSGGEQQRVAIARALINQPPVILADEPTGNLDARSTRLVLDVFADLWKRGHTLVVVSHNPEVVGRAQRVIVLRHGKVAADVPVDASADLGDKPWITWSGVRPPSER